MRRAKSPLLYFCNVIAHLFAIWLLVLLLTIIPILLTIQKIDFNPTINHYLSKYDTGFKIQIGEIRYNSKKYMSAFSTEITDIKVVLHDSEKNEQTLNLSSGIKFEVHWLGLLISSFYRGITNIDTSYFSLIVEGVSTQTIFSLINNLKPSTDENSFADVTEKYRHDGEKIYTFLNSIERYHPKIKIQFIDFHLCETLQLLSPNSTNYCSNNIRIEEIALISNSDNSLLEEISIQKTIGNQKEKKIQLKSFSNVRFQYSENRRIREITGSLLKDTKKNVITKALDYISAIESDDNNEMFGIVLSGELPRIDFNSETSITSENFKTILAYRYSDTTAFWRLNSNNLNIGIPSLTSPISFESIAFEGFYDVYSKYLKVSDLKLDLMTANSSVPISFSGKSEAYHVDNNFITTFDLHLNTPFSHNLLYQYWPKNTSSDLHEELKQIIRKGEIQNADFNFKYQSTTGKNQMNLTIGIDDIVFSPKIQDMEHKVGIKKLLLKTDMKSMSLSTNSANLDDELEVKNIDVNIPFGSSDDYRKNSTPVTLVSLDIDASMRKLEKWYEKYFLDSDINKIWSFKKGDSKTKVKIGIPQLNRTPTLFDLKILIESDIRNLHLDLDNGKHQIRSPAITIKMKDCDTFVHGNVHYNDLILNELDFQGFLQEHKSQDETNSNVEFFPKNLKVTLPLDQDFLLQQVKSQVEIDSDFEGEIHIDLQNQSKANVNEKSFTITANLKDAGFNALNLGKKVGEEGFINANLTHRIHSSSNKIEDINISIPNFQANGQIVIDNGNLRKANLDVKQWDKNAFKIDYTNNLQANKTIHQYNIKGSIIDISPFVEISKKLKTGENTTVETKSTKQEQHVINIALEKLEFEKREVLDNLKLYLDIDGNKPKKVDASAYLADKSGYASLFFDSPVFAFVVNNVGELMKDVIGKDSLREGSFELKGDLSDDSKNTFKGYIAVDNFLLWRSHLLSTMLRVYSLSGGSYASMFKMLTSDGVDFRTFHCKVHYKDSSLYLNECAAISDVMFINADAKFVVDKENGIVEGMIIPVNFWNVVMILIQKVFPKFGNDLLRGNKEKQNFSIAFEKDTKPVIKTNPVSFILPGFLGQMLSQKRSSALQEKQD